jgi:hypothetical protein
LYNGDSSVLPHRSWEPETETDRTAVRDQLERILATPLFRNSKRYTGFLRFIVEEALAGRADLIKERTLGTDVFGRKPDYDTTEDHVVRTAASEVRRRIVQYYALADHDGEVRIELPSGSYAPRFYPARAGCNGLNQSADLNVPVKTLIRSRTSIYVGLVLLACAWILFALLRSRSGSASALDEFWRPVVDTGAPVIVSIGQGGDMSGVRPPPGVPERLMAVEANEPARDASAPPLSIAGLAWLRCERVNLADAITAWRVSSYLESKSRRPQLQGECGTDYSELRSGPAVLIGAINNAWTHRLMGQLRYTFDIDRTNFVMRIRDSENPTQTAWKVEGTLPSSQMTRDYAIVTRVLDPSTERMVVVVGGLTKYGTLAAGEFLTDGMHLAAFAKHAPKGWEHKDLQVVLATKVIGGHSGPPEPIASWYR